LNFREEKAMGQIGTGVPNGLFGGCNQESWVGLGTL